MRMNIITIRVKMTIVKEKVVHQEKLIFKNSMLQLFVGSDRQISSAALLGNHGSLAIQHHGERYILRQTRAGKLILTK